MHRAAASTKELMACGIFEYFMFEILQNAMRVSRKFRLIAELCGCSESCLDKAVEHTECFKTELEEGAAYRPNAMHARLGNQNRPFSGFPNESQVRGC